MLAIVPRFIQQILVIFVNVITIVIIVLIELIRVVFIVDIIFVVRVEILVLAVSLSLFPIFTRKTIFI